jgi:hypothetical protein
MFKFTFKEFFFITENEKVSGVIVSKNKHPKDENLFFVVLYGNTIPIKKELKDMGFKYFQGSWSIRSDFFTKEKKDSLTNLGIDFSDFDKQETIGFVDSNKPADDTAFSHSSSTENMLSQMNQVIDTALKSEDIDKNKKILEDIDKKISQLALSTDEAAKQDFIQAFLKFSSKFYNYSFSNQLLIWVQTKGRATAVASQTNWTKMGRTVVNWKNPIKIWAPNFKKINKDVRDKDTGEEKTETIQLKLFKLKNVYDVSDTAEIPNHPNPYKPISRNQWSVDSNESIEELEILINASLEFIRKENIDFDYEDLDEELGGYSAGKKIRINNSFKGINVFSTIIHELAHELLHQDKQTSKESSKQEKEIDAESTAYVVLSHFGFETKDSPNYLALWRASGENVKSRAQQISNASKIIINGIKKIIQEIEIEDEDETS